MADLHSKIRIKVGDVEIEVEGEKDFVVSQAKILKDEWLTAGIQKPQSEELPERNISRNDQPLGEFYVDKDPRPHTQKIATFGAYFENYQGKKSFSAQDLLSAYDEVRESRPKNIHDVLSKTYKRAKYILPADQKGQWRLSKTGIALVESLPGKRSLRKE